MLKQPYDIVLEQRDQFTVCLSTNSERWNSKKILFRSDELSSLV